MGYPVAKIPAAKIRQFLEAIEPEVIIECPACQTKFRIEASKLAAESSATSQSGKAKARFHCSRCDYVFSAEVASSDMSHSEKEVREEMEEDTIPALSNTNQSNITDRVDIPAPITEDPGPQYHVDFEDLNYTPPAPEMPIDIEFEKPSEINTRNSAEQQQLAFNFTSPASLASPTSFASEITESAINPNPVKMADPIVIENTPSNEDIINSAESFGGQETKEPDSFSSKNETANWPDHSADYTSFSNFHIEPVSPHEISEVEATRVVDDLPASLAQYKYTPPNNNTGQIPEDYSRYALDFSQHQEEANAAFASKAINSSPISNNIFSSPSNGPQSSNAFGSQAAHKQRNPNLTSLAVLTLPLIIGISLLGATTLYLGKNLSASEKLLTSIFPKAQRETPSGVFVQQPKLEATVLDSGDIVNVVTGTIVNQSKKILTSLTIEGLGFSDSGQITTSEKVLVGNPISINNATLKTLTPSNIKELQSKEPKNFILRPDAKTKFTLVFTKPVKATAPSANSDTEGNMSSFAVRVYSSRFRSE